MRATQRMAAGSKEIDAEPTSEGVANKILLSFFWGVLQSCLVLQSDAQLFTAACGGDAGRTARAFGAVSGAAGIASLFVNQAGGKLSDSLGRKQLFMLGPLCNVLANVWVFRSGSSSLAVLMVCKVVRLVFSTFSGSTMAMAGLMDISSAQEMAQMGARLQTSAGIGECALGH